MPAGGMKLRSYIGIPGRRSVCSRPNPHAGTFLASAFNHCLSQSECMGRSLGTVHHSFIQRIARDTNRHNESKVRSATPLELGRSSSAKDLREVNLRGGVMDNWLFGSTMTLVGMGGTLITLWLVSLSVSLLKVVFPLPDNSHPAKKA